MQNIANWILAGIQLIATTFSGLIGYVFKKETSRVKALEERVENLEKTLTENYMKKCDCKPVNGEEFLKYLSELELRMTDKFVPRKEYYRAQGEVSKKLDRICEILMERN